MDITKQWIDKLAESMMLDFATAKILIERVSQHMPPIPMVLFCPKCGVQHIDKADEPNIETMPDAPIDGLIAPEDMTARMAAYEQWRGWTNPPHRSHLCHACGCIWRPCDIPTVGVEKIETAGKADNFDASKPRLDTVAIPQSGGRPVTHRKP